MSAHRCERPLTCQHADHQDRLMTWEAPRVSQSTHAALAVLVGLLLIVGGAAIVAAIVPSTLLVLLFVALWSGTVSMGVNAYAVAVIRR